MDDKRKNLSDAIIVYFIFERCNNCMFYFWPKSEKKKK